jgi:hypothetical protein
LLRAPAASVCVCPAFTVRLVAFGVIDGSAGIVMGSGNARGVVSVPETVPLPLRVLKPRFPLIEEPDPSESVSA